MDKKLLVWTNCITVGGKAKNTLTSEPRGTSLVYTLCTNKETNQYKLGLANQA